jgi:hypothetical protein
MWKWIIFNAVLFYVLSPGVLVRLPPKASHTTVLVTHAIVFAIVHKLLSGFVKQLEFFDMPDTKTPAECPAGTKRSANGMDCEMPGH